MAKQSKPKKYIFLYNDPYIMDVTDTFSDPDTFTFLGDREDPLLISEENDLRAMLLKFGADMKILEKVPDSATLKVRMCTNREMGSFESIMAWTNFRSLSHPDRLGEFIRNIEQRDQIYLNSVVDFHAHLGYFFSARLLNTVCDRTLQAVRAIPFSADVPETYRAWRDIHVEYPFMWVLILVQAICRSEAIPLT